jgi:hypothetical protein
MATQTTDSSEVYPGRVYPSSRPGIKFVICVAAAAAALIAYLIFG